MYVQINEKANKTKQRSENKRQKQKETVHIKDIHYICMYANILTDSQVTLYSTVHINVMYIGEKCFLTYCTSIQAYRLVGTLE